MRWDPVQYGRFAAERGRPFLDLVAQIGAADPRRVVDLGCGPGTLTAVLADRWPMAQVEGIDSSAEMIAAGAARAQPNVRFSLGDATAWSMPADLDVLVSNATLQWVPDHLQLLAGWAAALPVGGWLAVQMPGNFGSPSHTLMRALAESPRWRDRLDGVLRHVDAVAEPAAYAQLLLAAGLVPDVWETTYLHVLTGPDPVLDWVRGTGLRPVLAALSPEDAREFEAEYAAQLRAAYPVVAGAPDGAERTLFPFHRIFAVGHRA